MARKNQASEGFNFDEPIRKSLAQAREEAARLRHEYVGTEHVLLGLTVDRTFPATRVLESLGVDVSALRASVERNLKLGKIVATARDMPFTSRAKRVLELGMSAARHLAHDYVGTEHALLGLIAEDNGIAAIELKSLGLTVDRVLKAVAEFTGAKVDEPWEPPPAAMPGAPLPTTTNLKSTAAAHVLAVGTARATLKVKAPTVFLDELRRRFSSLGPEFRSIGGSREMGATVPRHWRDDMLTVIADMDSLPADVVVEVLAALDMLHRAWGGNGLVLEAQSVGAAEDVTATV